MKLHKPKPETVPLQSKSLGVNPASGCFQFGSRFSLFTVLLLLSERFVRQVGICHENKG